MGGGIFAFEISSILVIGIYRPDKHIAILKPKSNTEQNIINRF
jgi:hypothetical protein